MADRPPMRMVRRGGFLAPVAPCDSEALEKLPAGVPLNVRATRPRSAPRNRLYFALLDLVDNNLDQDVTGDDLHEWLKLKLGVRTPVRQRNGSIAYVPSSTAFDKMDEVAFGTYFEKAKTLLVDQIIPGLNRDALEREARLMLGESI